ncbi:MAG: pilus assembly protein PilP [Saccharospirillaceae bacterium]|nr:pilus assembly protein PilP [Pseudomonadales bacterium]NRB78277.1 pilus assembly protein PilP [Saccharospirillaceae bacterium]
MKKLLIVCTPLLFAGCMNLNDNADLQKKIEDTVNNAPIKIEKIVPPEDPIEFVYSAAGNRSPFQAEKVLLPIPKDRENAVFPIADRTPEPLEEVRIENISMVGTLGFEGGDLVALIRVSASDDSNGVYPVKVGEYLGLNHGKIISINPSHISINEIVSQGKSSWQARPRTIQLINQ